MANNVHAPSADQEPVPIPISVLAPDPKNPRRMSAEARTGLSVSLKTFGALDITFNTRTGQLVSGHQRIAELKTAGAAVVTMVSKEWGYVVHPATGERFWVRFVDWDETKQRMANLTANNPHISGDFTDDALEQLQELESVEEFAELELGALEKELKAGLDRSTPPAAPEGSSDQSGELGDSWQIVISCASEQHQRKLLERFEAEGLSCRALI